MEGSTGDMKNNLMKLLREARRMKLQLEPNVQGLSLGSPSSFLPLLHAALMHYSLPLANWLTKHNYDLYSKNDLRFLQELYRVLRDVFHYKPKLTKEQFLSNGYAERKVLFATHVLLLCQTKHSELAPERPKTKKSMLHTRNHGINRGTNVCIVKEQPLTSAQAIRSDSPPLPIGDHSSHVTPGTSMGTITTLETPANPHFSAPPLLSGHTHTCSTPPRLVSPVRELQLTPHASPIPMVYRHSTPPQIEPTLVSTTIKRDVESSPSSPLPENWQVLPEKEASEEDDHSQTDDDEAVDKGGGGELRDVSSRIEELTKVVERMSAKLVLLETQVKLGDSQKLKDGCETQSPKGKRGGGESFKAFPREKEEDKEDCLKTQTEGIRVTAQPCEETRKVYHSTSKKYFSLSRTETPPPTVSRFTSDTPTQRQLLQTPTTRQLGPLTNFNTPTTPEDTRQMIESLRARAKKTKEFLQLANSRQPPHRALNTHENIQSSIENVYTFRTNIRDS